MHHAQSHVLLVDDDDRIRSMLGEFLRARGLAVSVARDGQQMIATLRSSEVDLVLLDVMLPDVDGLTLCRRVRAESEVAIILLTAINETADRVAGLELGADDYVAKPFDPSELLARIRAVLRRRAASDRAVDRDRRIYAFDGWRLDPRRRTLRTRADVLVDLTSGEFDLLLAFVECPQEILSRDNLLDLARGRANQSFDRSIDVQISRLRRKLESNPAEPQLIKTIRNEGYLFTPEVTRVHPEKAR